MEKSHNPVAHFIEVIRPHKNERRVRIDILYYGDKVVRFLKITSAKMRDKLKRSRVTRLPDVPVTQKHEQIVSEAKQYLKDLVRDVKKDAKVYQFPKPYRSEAVNTMPSSEAPRDAQVPQGWTLAGTLVAAGKEWRQRSRKSKRFQQFCIDVQAKPNESPIRLWGGDLRRAINEAGAHVGDTIEVRSLGQTLCTINEKVTLGDGSEMIEPKPVVMHAYEVIKRFPGTPDGTEKGAA